MTTTPPSVHPYERLQAWAACNELVAAIYRVTSGWPQREVYGLTAQVRRSAFSAAANICEGSMRKGPREFRRFLDISMGSLSELSYAIKLATTLGYMHQDQATEIEILRDHASRLTWGLYRAIARAGKRDKSAEGNPGMGTGKPASRG